MELRGEVHGRLARGVPGAGADIGPRAFWGPSVARNLARAKSQLWPLPLPGVKTTNPTDKMES